MQADRCAFRGELIICSGFQNLLGRFNDNAHYIGSLRIRLAIFNLSNHPVLGFAGVGSFLPRALVRSDSRFLIHLSADVPKNDLRTDVAADWFSVLEQLDA